MEKIIMQDNAILLHKSIVKSETFNRVQIKDLQTRETVSRLIREKFFSYPNKHWHNLERNELIKTALNLGLNQLSSELTQHT
jgi:hypothetical protein